MSKKYRLIHDRDICISCSACASICPKYWEMEDDGKASIIGHTRTGNGEEEVLGTKEKPLTEDFEENMEAAECCPVNCIHVNEFKDDGSEEELI